MTLNQAIETLNRVEKAVYALNHAMDIMNTDGETVAPKDSWRVRGEAMAYLSGLAYQEMQAPETEEALKTILQHRGETDEMTFRRAEVLQEDYADMHVLPMDEYVAYNQLVSDAGAVWREAKENNDYASFAPLLEKLIAARRRYAALKAPEKPAYDVLLDQYEKGACMETLDPFFAAVRQDLAEGNPGFPDPGVLRGCPAAFFRKADGAGGAESPPLHSGRDGASLYLRAQQMGRPHHDQLPERRAGQPVQRRP